MATSSTREGESSSVSSSFLPQLRQSRPGSVASLSSLIQVDKDTLSQALDQIHSTASQTETLTTFNEYTSPPSSSLGVDSKGIASELQGGLSGLYSRFRASVAIVKDIANTGDEKGVVGKESSKSQAAIISSPKPYKIGAESASRLRSSTATAQGESASVSGKQSSIATVTMDGKSNDQETNFKPSTVSLDNTGTSTKSVSASLAALKPTPPSLRHAVQPITVGPALAEVIINAAKSSSSSLKPPSDEESLPTAFAQSERNTWFQDRGDEHPSHRSPINDSSGPRKTEHSKISLSKPQKTYAEAADTVGDTEPSKKDSVTGTSRAPSSGPSSPNGVRTFPSLGVDGTDGPPSVLRGLPADHDKNSHASLIAAHRSSSRDDVFAASNRDIREHASDSLEIEYQHLILPSRKSTALPLIRRSHSRTSHLSTASSTDTRTDSLVEIQQQKDLGHAQLSLNDSKGDFRPPPNVPPTSAHHDLGTKSVFFQAKNRVLNKEYWMKDENARDCFSCGSSFSTFRRKHHCRICGQIFDAKCTTLLSGEYFGQSGTLRVCRPCETIVKGDNDSSDFSDDGNLLIPSLRPRHGSTGASDALATPFPNSSSHHQESFPRSPAHPDLSVPTMSIPATRKAREKSSRKPTVLEIEAQQTLVRPSSSRSLRSAHLGRSYPIGHRRHGSRHQLQRSFKPVNEESAPFHQNPTDGKPKQGHLPAFHDDNIIDPDLAPYLSDEASSGDEQMGIMAALNGEGLSRSHENERQGLTGFLAPSRKARSRFGDKSISGVMFASRETDNHSLSSSRTVNPPRSARRRNLSISGNAHVRASPRSYRANVATPTFGTSLHESPSGSTLTQAASMPNAVGGPRMIRSSSMRGTAAPAMELNNASLRHVRRLLHQILQDFHVPNVASWEKALLPILLRATDDVNPDVQNGDDIDIRHYVKLKKIPGGRPGDTSYVSGLVFTKNLALKSMPRSISQPNILILTFPLEYARQQPHFMSIEPVIRQEREYLQNLVNRIAALRPQILLVERNVAFLAMELLRQANIATAYNVKASVLEAVSRCCQTRIISSIDKLAIKPASPGKCASFYLKTYVNDGRKKTYMFLSGCAKELGCTIVLRGDDDATLAKMKRITEFMIYVVYNLKLETCLMRDEFALVPSMAEIGSMSPEKEPARQTLQEPSLAESDNAAADSGNVQPKDEEASTHTAGKATIPEKIKHIASQDVGLDRLKIGLPDEDSMPDDVPMPTFYGDMVDKHNTKILSASPFVKFMPPYLLMRAREQERRLAYLKRLRDQDVMEELRVDEKAKPPKFDLIKPEMVHERVQTASRKVREVLHAVHDAEYDKALHTYETQRKQWEAYIFGNAELFNPFAHQNIAVLYSVVCTVTTVPCSGPDLLALAYYNEHETDEDFEADCTIGQYVEDICLGANTVCTANGCERKMIEHHRQYVHGEAQLSVFVERYPCKLRGLQDTILMWSVCRICGKETQVMPMSESTWKYSYGKYLELSFWSSDLRARADICPHDIHRNHLRYFGFKDLALRVHYDPITLLEIIVPRARITWKVDNDLRFKNEVFTRIEDRLTKFMYSVKARIKGINTESVVLEKTESCNQMIEQLSKRATEEHHALIHRLRENYMNSKHWEIIPMNRGIRATQERVAEWDTAFAEFDRNFFPSEKDIRRLATLQLKKIFLDRDDSISSLTSTEEGSINSNPEGELNEKAAVDETLALAPQTRRMSPEKAQDMLASVVEEHVYISDQLDQHQSSPVTAVPGLHSESGQAPVYAVDTEVVRNLDLAVSSEFPERPLDDRPSSVDHPGTQPGVEREPLKSSGHAVSSILSLPEVSTRVNLEPNANFQQPNSSKSGAPEHSHASGIPRPIETNQRHTRSNKSPTLYRTQSQPAHFRSETSISGSFHPSVEPQGLNSGSQIPRSGEAYTSVGKNGTKAVDKKLSDRLGLTALKQTSMTAQSMIPRSIASRRKESKVSNLAKHFEQLSREFERERMRERRQQAATSRQSRAYPMAASKPIVQVYRDVREAVEEKEPSDEDPLSSGRPNYEESVATSAAIAESQVSQTLGEDFHPAETTAENTDIEEDKNDESHVVSDAEGDQSGEDHSLPDETKTPGIADEHHALSPDEAQLNMKFDLPKHEKSSLMKMLTNFWAERSASGWQPLEYPLKVTDHIFADSDIIVRENEPSSLIAFVLSSDDYQNKLHNIMERSNEIGDPNEKSAANEQNEEAGAYNHHEKTGTQGSPSLDEHTGVEVSLLRPTGTHLRYQFSEGSAKMLCKVFYAEQFDAVRRKCGVAERIVESLSRCAKWDSKGGKTKSVFLKTLDDRLVLKSLSPIETQAFLRFAPAYFRIMSESLFHDLPSVIAKMLGFYQIVIKNPATGVDFNWFLLVMENLFYDRSDMRIFDLKGSMRNRRIQSTGEQNEVLLDENMVEFIYESPLFAREHSKKLLRASVWNDTLFLSRQNVMDYSLMIGMDEKRKELVVGIIDCIRTYTWDKKLESWIKDRGKNRPTVTSPKEYKSRFREAMGRYVLEAPNCWHQFNEAQQVEMRIHRADDPGEDKELHVVEI